MFQTWLDLNKQIIRKAIDGLSGVAIGYLGTQGQWGIALVPVVVIAGNALWFYLDNRNKVTVDGLIGSHVVGTNAVAADLKVMIAEAKKENPL